MGYSKTKVIDHTSSAGDWVFGIYDGEYWCPAFQENAYPEHGFRYSIDISVAAKTFEELTANAF